jgi:predicted RecA/RadA family phage recombinase
MPATFVQDGRFIDHTPAPGSDLAAGAVVVQGDLLGITVRPIPANTGGSLVLEGIFDFPKASGASTAIAVGVNVYWHADTQTANTTASGGKLIGKTVKAATDADTTVRARLTQ